MEGLDCEFLTLEQAGISSDPIEDADTFAGNALIKAQSAFAASGGLACLADDSGLVVDALDGAPGVYSARYAGLNASDADNNALLLSRLDGLEKDKRTARFVCAMVLIDEDGNAHTCEGSVEGFIGFSEAGEMGFGYDPLFYPDEYDGKLSFAEVSGDQKNKISHRFKALNGIKSILSSN